MNRIDELMGTADSVAQTGGSTAARPGVGDQLLVGLTDIDGLLRGKYVARAKADKSVGADMLVTAAWFGWDITDDPYGARTRLGGFHAGANDIPVRLRPETRRPLPGALGGGEIALLQCSGVEAEICPRSLLERQLEKAKAVGIEILVGTDNADLFRGGAAAETFLGGGGDDVLRLGADSQNDAFTGGGGIDSVDYSEATGPVIVDLSLGEARSAGGSAGSGIIP